MGSENIGFNLRGSSSSGKTTCARVANSVWGGEEDLQTCRTTDNGLEGIASAYNDRLLCLDEMGEFNPKVAGEAVYMLGNGAGKTRLTKSCDLRGKPKWRLIFFLTAEVALAQLLEQAGKQTKAGQEVRLVDIPADTGKHGSFEDLHGCEGGSAFSDYLKDTTRKYHGAPSREFVRQLIFCKAEALDFVSRVMERLTQQELSNEASGQVKRVCKHFALVAAGQLATKFGITGWEPGEAEEGVMQCFRAWVQSRGGDGLQEEKIALEQVKAFFEKHGESRFSLWDNYYEQSPEESKTINRVGFKRSEEGGGTEFFVFPTVFRQEICAGLDRKFVEKVCITKLLMSDTDGGPTRSERLSGSKKTTRCYRFTSEVLVN